MEVKSEECKSGDTNETKQQVQGPFENREILEVYKKRRHTCLFKKGMRKCHFSEMCFLTLGSCEQFVNCSEVWQIQPLGFSPVDWALVSETEHTRGHFCLRDVLVVTAVHRISKCLHHS